MNTETKQLLIDIDQLQIRIQHRDSLNYKNKKKWSELLGLRYFLINSKESNSKDAKIQTKKLINKLGYSLIKS